jgi:hypothetical protein
MQITYELTQADFTEAYSVHRNAKTWSKWFRRIFISTMGLISAVILFGFVVKPSWQQAKALTPFFVLMLIWIALIWLLPGWTMRRQFLQQGAGPPFRTSILPGCPTLVSALFAGTGWGL